MISPKTTLAVVAVVNRRIRFNLLNIRNLERKEKGERYEKENERRIQQQLSVDFTGGIWKGDVI